MTYDSRTGSAVPTATTLSSAARGGEVRAAGRRAPIDLAIWAAAVIAGSTIGGTLALHAAPPGPSAPPPATTAAPTAAAAPPLAVAASPSAAAASPPAIAGSPPAGAA